jgi:type IV pilus assembly protein PilV
MQNFKQLTTYKAKGFSLLEVLIAVFVIAFGLLGMAALQLKTVQNSHSAYQRTVASVIALDAAERLWINLALEGEIEGEGGVVDLWRTAHTDPNLLSFEDSEDLVLDCDANNNCTITVSWVENRIAGVPNGKEQFTYTITLY